MLIEVELDLLVGNVDAELLKRIFLEVFKPKDIENPNVQSLITSTEKAQYVYYSSPQFQHHSCFNNTPNALGPSPPPHDIRKGL